MVYARSACIKRVLRVDKKHKMLDFLFFSLTYFHNYLKHQLNLLKILSAYYVFDFDFFFLLSFFQIYLDLVMT